MAERLTDEQLVELVQTKSPADLTEGEVEQLRERVRESVELRTELIDHLHMESYLHAALGEFRVSIDELAERVEAAKRDRSRRTTFYGVGMGLLMLLLIVGGIGYVRSLDDGEPPEIVANDEAGDPSNVDGDADDSVKGGAAIKGGEPRDRGDDRPEPWATVIEAEDYVHSNLETDDEAYGIGIGVLVDGPEEERFAEFVVNPPHAGLYQIELRYASDKSRPLTLTVNGREVRTDAAGEDTGGWGPSGQRAFVEARVELPADRSVIRLAGTTFPHIDKLAVASVYDAAGPLVAATNALPTLALRGFEPVDVDAGPEGPWAEWLDPSREPFDFDEVCFDTSRPVTFENFSEADLRTWFEKPRSGSFRTEQRDSARRLVARFIGTGRLVPDWPADAALRASLFDVGKFEMRFWNGDEGVILRAGPHRTPGVWGAYSASRRDGRVDSKSLVLLATDSGRHQRTRWGPFELRWQDRALVMTRGDVRLLTVPLEKPPSEVEWDGEVWVSGLAMFRSTPASETAPAAQRIVARLDRPAELDWGVRRQQDDNAFELVSLGTDRPATWTAEPRDGASLTGHADGLVELTVEKTDGPTEVATAISAHALCDYVVRIRDASPGTGFFLGDAAGKPLERLCFLADRTSKGVSFGLQNDDGERRDVQTDAYHQPWPYVGNDQWFRLVRGPNVLKVFVSGDGIHWGMVGRIDIPRSASERVGSIGLFCHRTSEPRSIALERVDIREFSNLLDRVDDELLAKVPADELRSACRSYEEWFLAATRNRPDEVSLPSWLVACAVRTLQLRPPHQIAERFLQAIQRHEIDEDGPVEDRVGVFRDVALLSDRLPADRGARFVLDLEAFGEGLLEQGHESPYRTLARTFVDVPLWTAANLSSALETPDLARDAVIADVFSGDWAEVESTCRTRRFLLLSGHPDRDRDFLQRERDTVFTWAESLARRQLRLPPERMLAGFDRNWRHPLVAQSTKEAYNVMAEFESALAAGAFEDACRIVSATDEQGIVGLLPDTVDRSLLVSISRAVRSAMEDHPELKKTMIESFGDVAEIRVRRAIANGDVDGIRAATVRYLGTPAAGTAHLWLGDRDLSGGRTTQAIDHYETALETTEPAGVAAAQARLQMAKALLGQQAEDFDRPQVTLGDVSLSRDEFTRMAERVRAKRIETSDVLLIEDVTSNNEEVPHPANATVRGRFDGDAGQNPERSPPRGVDWVGRQLGTTVAGNDLVVCNRFQVTCYDATTGQRRWTRGLGGEQGFAHEWSLVPFEPVVAGESIFVRRLTKQGAEITCLNRKDGNIVWRTDSAFEFASDPLVVSGKLVAVVVEGPVDNQIRADLVTLHPATGEIVSRAHILAERDAWSGMPPCTIAAASDAVLGVVGGSAFLAEPLGDVHWIRRLPWIPVKIDAQWTSRYVGKPIVGANRFYLTWPHSYQIGCFDVASGRAVWTQSSPDVRGLVGHVDGKSSLLVVRTDDGFEGRQAEDGTVVWKRSAPNAFDGARLVGETLVCIDGPVDRRGRMDWVLPVALSIDGLTGDLLERSPLPSIEGKERQIGPIAVGPDRLWTFVGENRRDPHRDLVELSGDERDAPFAADASGALEAWRVDSVRALESHVERVAPGWTLVSDLTFQDGSAGRRLNFENEQNVLVTRADPNRPALLLRRLTVPEQGCHVDLRIRNDRGNGWKLRLLVGTRVVHEQEVENAWTTVSVDLSEFAGRSIWITLEHSPNEAGGGTYGFWKNIEIRPGAPSG